MLCQTAEVPTVASATWYRGTLARLEMAVYVRPVLTVLFIWRIEPR